MVDKRKDQDISFTTAQQTIINNFVRSEKRTAMLIGLVLGFILNTVSAVAIALTCVEVSRAGLIDNAVERTLNEYIQDTKEMRKIYE